MPKMTRTEKEAIRARFREAAADLSHPERGVTEAVVNVVCEDIPALLDALDDQEKRVVAVVRKAENDGIEWALRQFCFRDGTDGMKSMADEIRAYAKEEALAAAAVEVVE